MPNSCTKALEVHLQTGHHGGELGTRIILRANFSRLLISRHPPSATHPSQRHPSRHCLTIRCWDGLRYPLLSSYVEFIGHHALPTKIRYRCIPCCRPFSRRTFGRRRVLTTSATAGQFSSCIQEHCFLGCCFLERQGRHCRLRSKEAEGQRSERGRKEAGCRPARVVHPVHDTLEKPK